jgi:hypothetical protein
MNLYIQISVGRTDRTQRRKEAIKTRDSRVKPGAPRPENPTVRDVVAVVDREEDILRCVAEAAWAG